MAELTFKSAGVSTREIDLSGPTPTGPTGVPAGIIGTALEGPAFVPLTFANYGEFKLAYGASDGAKFGPIAVNQWLKNAQAVTYVRVLGAGDGKKRDSATGNVTNAGFVVGQSEVQANGIVGNNAFSNPGGEGHGRTYFLGCFMSESNGSTIFSDAGIQKTSPASGFQAVATTSLGVQSVTLTSKKAGASRNTKTFQLEVAADAANPTDTVLVVFTGTADAIICTVTQNDGTNNSGTPVKIGSDDLVALINAAPAHSSTTAIGGHNITLTDASGLIGLQTASGGGTTHLANSGEGDSKTFTFSTGIDGNRAVPILRGVILAPSGVVLNLSGNAAGVTSGAPSPAYDSSTSVQGFRSGSVSLTSGGQDFVILMNGFKAPGADSSNPQTVISASFDMTANNYFANVLNTDPLKTEEKGHLLYGSYDIHPNLAVPTGSGVMNAQSYLKDEEPIAMLLTSSVARVKAGIGAVASNVPVYESFEDRFSHAISPFIISQGYGAAPYDLFRVKALSAGEGLSTKFKVSIENIVKSTSDSDKFGTFDLLVRDFNDTDDERVVLESFRGLSLDPGSSRFVGRAIGDQEILYNFDADKESQKIVVDGTHTVRSRFIRVQMSNAIKKNEVPDDALPVGFRGPSHLLTSGSLLNGVEMSKHDAGRNTGDHQKIIEPPFPYRKTVAQGTGLQKRSDTTLYWGMQPNRVETVNTPNANTPFENSLKTFVKHFPNHRKDAINFSVGNNPGVADQNGAVLDCDRFNNNRFSLEKIQVRTGSDTFADPEQWLSASYVRNGVIAINHVNKTRGLSMSDFDIVGNRKYLKFTLPLQGGFDGVDIFNKDKRNLTNNAVKREIDDSTNQGGTAGPTVASYRKAVDIMASTSDVDIQLLSVPGIRHSSVTDFAIDAMENRFDAMLIMDIEERDQFNTVITSSVQNPHVANTVTSFKNRALDSSFAAAYFPDVTVADPDTGALVSVPPSVVTLGAYSLNDRVGHPWFAPAGFTRGALKDVVSTKVSLNRTNLDDLYDADINPLAKYPSRPLSIWGQKTLLAANSALDRVNIRRLLIDVRRKVRGVANTLLFEPNRSETLDRFSRLVNPILQSVQEKQGVDRFRVIIDTTTTTQADVENNTIRGKIFLQPTRSIEFVALDFVVTNAGTTI
jgi:phage tail sheath protein FI